MTTKKNFKTLRVGHYYRRADGVIVKISAYHAEDRTFMGLDTWYYSDGMCLSNRLNLDEEVTVTPVESPKPRECWVLYGGNGDVVDVTDIRPMFYHAVWVHMREVLEDEEGEGT